MHGYFLPLIEEFRAQNKIKPGKKKCIISNITLGKTRIELNGVSIQYEGELDENNKPYGCGKGFFAGFDKKIEATWLNGVIHGLCK